jgi:hypothetical protein
MRTLFAITQISHFPGESPRYFRVRQRRYLAYSAGVNAVPALLRTNFGHFPAQSATRCAFSITVSRGDIAFAFSCAIRTHFHGIPAYGQVASRLVSTLTGGDPASRSRLERGTSRATKGRAKKGERVRGD